jgi:hypothetical protein
MLILLIFSIGFSKSDQMVIKYTNSNSVYGKSESSTLTISDSIAYLEKKIVYKKNETIQDLGKYRLSNYELNKLKENLNNCFKKRNELSYTFEMKERGSTNLKTIYYLSDTTTKIIQIYNLNHEKKLPKNIIEILKLLNDIWDKILINQNKEL